MPAYTDDQMLMLSGIQHFAFCPRQWALIHLEQLWSDNGLTSEGSLLHSNVDDPFRRYKNGSNVITLRGFNLASSRLGLSGTADAIELHPSCCQPMSRGELIAGGQFEILPIEYKRGHRKVNDCDRMQVAAQAMILEEIFDKTIARGAIFYWQERRREYFEINDELRAKVTDTVREMHRLNSEQITPKAVKKPCCRSCSLYDLCMPSISGRSVREYLRETSQTEP